MAQASSSQAFQTPQPPKTALAQIYSHPCGKDYAAIAHIQPYKSGLTPGILSPNAAPQDVLQRAALEAYQRAEYHGFTANELEICEAFTFAATNVQGSDFDEIPIHPILDKQKWQTELPKHLAHFPLGLGREGFWTVDNPVVWEALVPALKLATLMLNNCHTWPWWDAYLSDQFVLVSEFEIPSDEQQNELYRFRNRPPRISSNEQERQAGMDKLNDLGKEIEFSISCQEFSTTSGYQAEKALGYTTPATEWSKTICNISLELIEPLLSPRTCVAEKFLAREEIAATLLHEIAHALWLSMRPTAKYTEPYYEDEVIAETGASMENAMLGGLHEGFNGFIPAQGLGLGWIFSFNTRGGTYMSEEIVLNNKPPGWRVINYYPVPAQHYSNMNNSLFWKVFVKRYGQKSTHMGPEDVWCKTRQKLNLKAGPINFPDGDFGEDLVIKDTMRDDEKQIVDFENDRRAHIRRIKAAMEEFRSRPVPEVPDQSSTSPMVVVENYIEPRFIPPSNRHQEIQQFLFANWDSLALESMDFEIPEHILYSYVVRAGLSDLTPTEWRAFLLECTRTADLFSLRETNYAPAATPGHVLKIDIGWPTPQSPQQPEDMVEPEFYQEFARALDIANGDDDGFDFDKDILQDILNRILRDETVNKHYSDDEFDKCIVYSILVENCTTAPEGIVRRNAHSDSSGVIAPEGIQQIMNDDSESSDLGSANEGSPNEGNANEDSANSSDFMSLDSSERSDQFEPQGDKMDTS